MSKQRIPPFLSNPPFSTTPPILEKIFQPPPIEEVKLEEVNPPFIKVCVCGGGGEGGFELCLVLPCLL